MSLSGAFFMLDVTAILLQFNRVKIFRVASIWMDLKFIFSEAFTVPPCGSCHLCGQLSRWRSRSGVPHAIGYHW